jgi:ASC-1-like (ASCH) protein
MKENFEKMDAAMKAKKKSEITKADTDAFNKAVNEYNTAVKTYNTINNSLNTKRSKVLEGWNKSVENFLMKHAA